MQVPSARAKEAPAKALLNEYMALLNPQQLAACLSRVPGVCGATDEALVCGLMHHAPPGKLQMHCWERQKALEALGYVQRL
jgi:hypothetical protein